MPCVVSVCGGLDDDEPDALPHSELVRRFRELAESSVPAAEVDAAAKQGAQQIYAEIVAKHGVRKPRAVGEAGAVATPVADS